MLRTSRVVTALAGGTQQRTWTTRSAFTTWVANERRTMLAVAGLRRPGNGEHWHFVLAANGQADTLWSFSSQCICITVGSQQRSRIGQALAVHRCITGIALRFLQKSEQTADNVQDASGNAVIAGEYHTNRSLLVVLRSIELIQLKRVGRCRRSRWHRGKLSSSADSSPSPTKRTLRRIR